MAFRRRRKRARKEAASVTDKTVTKDEEPTQDERVPAGQQDLPPEGADAEDLDAVHDEAVERYECAWDKDRQNQHDAYDDLRFLAEEEAQWDGAALRDRRDSNRPVLTVNKCPQFIRQVTGDIRQLRPSIHVVPIDEKADNMVSTDVLPEMVRYIERRSDAKASYFSAADQMVAAGIGHCRVFTEYAAATTANQEIGITLIQDGIAVVWDPDAIHPTRKDANYCFVPVDLNRKAAEARWKGRKFEHPLTHDAWNGWHQDDAVRVTEYWRKVPMQRELAVYPNGQIVDLTDDDYDPQAEEDIGYGGDVPYEQTADYGPDHEDKPTKDDADYRPGEGERRCGGCTMFQAPSHCTAIQDPVRADMLCDYFEPFDLLGNLGDNIIPFPVRPQLAPGMGPKRADAIAGGARIEKRDSYRVERFVMSAGEILDGPDEWPGMHIPIVPFLGEEIKIGRQIVRRGVVRNLKDVQRLFNYAISADAEAVALQPKAPFKGTRVNFEKALDQWETANSRNWPFLEYEPDPLNGGRPPEREPPPVASQGIKELLNVATQEMSAVTGIYPSSLGAPAQETSGKAIVARQREGDTGTFVYIESFGRAIERIGQIIVDLIPHIYDNERSLRVIGDDGKMSKIDINKQIIDPNGDGIATVLMNDLTSGSYQVSVEMGPSYSTKREEAREGIQTLMQALGPQSAPLLADLFVQGQDFPLADRIAKRMRLLLPPNVQQLEAAQSGEPPPPQPPPPPPPPEVLMKQEELKLQMQEMQGEMAVKGKELEIKEKELAIKDKELALKEIEIRASMEQARMTNEAAALGHAQKANEKQADLADSQAQRDHETQIAEMNNAATVAAAAPPPTDEQQQKQIDQLVKTVTQLQQQITQLTANPPGEMMSVMTDAIGQLNKPRKAIIHRDPRTGKVTGATSVTEN